MAQHTQVTHPLVVRRLQVLRTLALNPRTRRVTLGGPELDAFHRDGFDLPAFVSQTFDDHVKLVFAADGDIEAALPVQRARSIDWPPSEHRQGRDYTPRRWDPSIGELDLDFVLHGDGPAAQWASAATPGDHLHVVGPKSSLVLPESIDWVLLAGDETALPAIGRYLDERPVDAPVQVVVEIRHPGARQELAVRPGDTMRWVVVGEHEPSPLAETIKALDWWPGHAYAWAAGESRSLIPLRRWLRHDRGLAPSHVNVTGYWHADTEAAAGGPAQIDLETMLSPLPWLATRAAVDLGLLEQLAAGPGQGTSEGQGTARDLAMQIQVDADVLQPLLAYLVAAEVLSVDGEVYSLGRLGEELMDDDHLQDELFGPEARLLESLSELAPALRSQTSTWQQAYGRTQAAAVEDDRSLFAARVEAAGAFAFVAGGVVDIPVWAEVERISLCGPGAAVLLQAAADRDRSPADAAVWGTSTELAVLAEAGGDRIPAFNTVTDASIPSDLAVSCLAIAYRTDAEVTHHLRELADRAPRALLIDALEHTGPGAPAAAAEHDLLDLAGIGRGARNAHVVRDLAAGAGWRVTGHVKLGWDFEAFVLER